MLAEIQVVSGFIPIEGRLFFPSDGIHIWLGYFFHSGMVRSYYNDYAYSYALLSRWDSDSFGQTVAGKRNHGLVCETHCRSNGYDPNDDAMYSSYIKAHAHKICMLTSHGLRDLKKFVLALGIAVGSATDSAVVTALVNEVAEILIPSAALAGDHAFHNVHRVICPYTIYDMRGGNKVAMSTFNSKHSSERMCSEHGNMFLKTWGIFRGRSDMRLIEKHETFVMCIKVIQALHNFKLLLD